MKDITETVIRNNRKTLLGLSVWKKLAINVGLALPGVAVVLLATNPLVQLAGGVWAAVNLLPVVKWVVGV